MIDTIEIVINNGIFVKYNIIISYNNNYCFCNNHKYIINSKQKNDIVRTIKTWKNEYGSSNIIDDEEFRVIVTTNDSKKEVFHGKGIFPNNYRVFKRIIGDIYE